MSTPAHEGPDSIVVAGHTGNEAIARTGLLASDPTTRAVALGALARLGRLSVEDLAAAEADPSPLVRRRVAEEGGRRVAGDPRPLLVRLLADGDDSVAEMAAWALGEHPPRSGDVAALAAVATGHDESLCREAAVAALGAMGHRDGLTAILHGTRDRVTVRRRAVLALAPFEGPEVDEALQVALDDRDWQVRQAAEDLVGAAPDADGDPG